MVTQASPSDSKAVLADPETRKKFKSSLAEITHYHRQVDDYRAGLKDAIASVAQQYGVNKKIVANMAKTMYKGNYSSLLEENRHFEVLYETVVEGALRPADGSAPSDGDPLDNQ